MKIAQLVLRKRDPISTLRYVLETLEKQAVKAGSHPVLIHEGLEALDRLEKIISVALCLEKSQVLVSELGGSAPGAHGCRF